MWVRSFLLLQPAKEEELHGLAALSFCKRTRESHLIRPLDCTVNVQNNVMVATIERSLTGCEFEKRGGQVL
jgi:hypothetical protein